MVALMSSGVRPSRAARAIYVCLYGWLTTGRACGKIGDTRHRCQPRCDLICCVGNGLEIVAEQLDRIFARYARHGFGSVVLQILGEVELNTWKRGLKF